MWPAPTYTPGPPPCLTVTLSGVSSPSLTQLTGTVFAASVPPSAPAPSAPASSSPRSR